MDPTVGFKNNFTVLLPDQVGVCHDCSRRIFGVKPIFGGGKVDPKHFEINNICNNQLVQVPKGGGDQDITTALLDCMNTPLDLSNVFFSDRGIDHSLDH